MFERKKKNKTKWSNNKKLYFFLRKNIFLQASNNGSQNMFDYQPTLDTLGLLAG